MTALLVALLLTASEKEKKDDSAVSVDSVTVNGETTTTPKASGAAATASTTGQQWSVVTARTLGAGANLVEGGLGFPGLHVGLLRGITQTLDVGARFSFNYGLEGQVKCNVLICPGNALLPGFKLQGVARYKFFDNGKLNAGVSFSPGAMFYFERLLGWQVGFAIPLAVRLGIVATSALSVAVVLDLPMWVLFGRNSSLVVPVLAGVGAEYFVTSSLAVWFDLRMGPSIWTRSFVGAEFTFDGKVGIGWRF
ncbi:MAG: hypothetical protein JNK82_25165 [Myxococcaceae bacterium]|nr:hypothetical protein [Myxococcaceae bacterium]